jgi:ferritin
MKLSDKTLDLMQRQVSIENTNNLIYLELADWCDFNSYPEAASLFRHQAAGEVTHRDKFRTFLLNINVQVKPFTLEKVPYDTPEVLEDCVLASLRIERETTDKINAIYRSAVDNGDYSVLPFIHWFLTEQVEEEMLFNNAITWIKNSGLTTAPDWAKGNIRQELSEYLEDLIEDDNDDDEEDDDD